MGNNVGEGEVGGSEGKFKNVDELAGKQGEVKERLVLLLPFVTN